MPGLISSGFLQLVVILGIKKVQFLKTFSFILLFWGSSLTLKFVFLRKKKSKTDKHASQRWVEEPEYLLK